MGSIGDKPIKTVDIVQKPISCQLTSKHLSEDLRFVVRAGLISHVTRGDLLQQPVAATCRSDLSHRVSRPLSEGLRFVV